MHGADSLLRPARVGGEGQEDVQGGGVAGQAGGGHHGHQCSSQDALQALRPASSAGGNPVLRFGSSCEDMVN